MSDYGTLQSHASAVLTLLRAQPNLVVFPDEDGGTQTVPPGTVPPYVAVRFATRRPAGGRQDHRSTRMDLRIYTYSVGLTEIAARAVGDMVSAALLDKRPDIPGRSVGKIKHEVANNEEPRVDESIGKLIVTLTETWRLVSEPGT